MVNANRQTLIQLQHTHKHTCRRTHTQATFFVKIFTSLAMMSNLDAISVARTSAKLALSRETLRVSANSVDQRLNVDRTSFLDQVDHSNNSTECTSTGTHVHLHTVRTHTTQTHLIFLCFVFFSNLSHNLSRFLAYSYSTSPRRLKNSWYSERRESLDSILKSRHPSWSFNCLRISTHTQ